MKSTVLIIDSTGFVRCLYSEVIDLSTIGLLRIQRASGIEFNEELQVWEVQGLDGKALYRNRSRELCLLWEAQHFTNQLTTSNQK
jgi:hypothetical protein